MGQLDSSWENVSISHASMIGADIMSAIMLHSADWPEELSTKLALLFKEWEKADDRDQDSILNEDIWDLLNEWAPEGYYFGASEGDGADFGFWKISDDVLSYMED